MKLLDVGYKPEPKPSETTSFQNLPKRKQHRYPNRYRWPIWYADDPDEDWWDTGDPPWWEDGAGLDNAGGV